MPNVREPLKVIKVPLTYKPDFKITRFPSMPRLYLELLENKQKVKPELRNKEYIPKSGDNLPSVQYASSIIDKEDKEENEFINNQKDSYQDESDHHSKNDSYKSSSFSKSKIVDLRDSKRDDSPKRDYYDKDYGKKDKSYYDKSKYSDEDDNSYKKSKSYDREDSPKRKDDDIPRKKEVNELINVLKTGNIVKSPISNNDFGEKISFNPSSIKDELKSQNIPTNTSIPTQRDMPSQKPLSNLPPSLQEIGEGKVPQGSTGSYYEVNIDKNDQTDLQRKREILHKFKYLRKYYPDVSIPEYNEYTDLSTLENEYNSLVKTLRIDSNVENYKNYLRMGFFGLEFFLSTVLKFEEIKGFSTAQALNMNQYERILVEIGEKSFVPEDKQIAPEFRLLGIILMNAAVFIGSKMMMKRMGLSGSSSGREPVNNKQQAPPQPNTSSFTNMFASMFGGGASNPMSGMNQQPNQQQSQQQNQKQSQPEFIKKKTMKGPDMSEFEEIINKKNV